MTFILENTSAQNLERWFSAKHLQQLNRHGHDTTSLLNRFQVSSTLTQISAWREKTRGRNVALQFPDALLHCAPFVCDALTSFANQDLDDTDNKEPLFFFALGDTSYGECCVDEVAALHLSAELIVHYGNACLSPTRTLPVLYVFPSTPLESRNACECFESVVRKLALQSDVKRIVILFDQDLHWYFNPDRFTVGSRFVSFDNFDSLADVHVALLRIQDHQQILYPNDKSWDRENARSVGAHAFHASEVPIRETAFIWFAAHGDADLCTPAVRNAALQLCTGPNETCHSFLYASLNSSRGSEAIVVNASTILRRRYALMSKVKDSHRIGIVPGTLGISGNTEMIERCKNIIRSSGKRAYVMLVGKPNPTKLANFPEIDVFVLIACPQNALLEGRDYMQPIVTPLELEAALLKDGNMFESTYTTDFNEILKRELPLDEDSSNGDGADERGLTKRADWEVTVHGEGGAAEFLNNRLWKGLRFSEGGNDELDIAELGTDVVVGQHGIASRYDKEAQAQVIDSEKTS